MRGRGVVNCVGNGNSCGPKVEDVTKYTSNSYRPSPHIHPQQTLSQDATSSWCPTHTTMGALILEHTSLVESENHPSDPPLIWGKEGGKKLYQVRLSLEPDKNCH